MIDVVTFALKFHLPSHLSAVFPSEFAYHRPKMKARLEELRSVAAAEAEAEACGHIRPIV